MPLFSALLSIVVVAALVVAAARVLPRMVGSDSDGAARPPFGTSLAVAVLAATAVAQGAAMIAGAHVAVALTTLLFPQGGHAFVASPEAADELAFAGAFAVFALIVAPLAAVAVTRAFTMHRGAIARVAAAALVGEAVLTGIALALAAAFSPTRARTPDGAAARELTPFFDVVSAVRATVDMLAVFALVGVLAGVALSVIAMGPPLRARTAGERRALIVAACAVVPGAFVLGGLAAPSPDALSQMLLAIPIGVIWLVAVVLGLGVRGLAGLCTSAPRPPAPSP